MPDNPKSNSSSSPKTHNPSSTPSTNRTKSLVTCHNPTWGSEGIDPDTRDEQLP